MTDTSSRPSASEIDDNARRPANVIVSRREIGQCSISECRTPAPFTVWADVTDESGDHSDYNPLGACPEHLTDVCVTKLKSQDTKPTEPEERSLP